MGEEITKNSLAFHTGHNLHAKNTVRIPESHTLHVGPAACARRHAIKAFENHDAANVSHLAVSEEDLAAGSYEDRIIEAVATLNETLPAKPRLYFICLKCVDDLIGTDGEAMVETLEKAFPEQRFAITRIDPIMLSDTRSPSEQNKATHYRFIEPNQPHDNGVTLIGSYTDIPTDCELRDVLASWNMGPIRRILDCKTYADYQDLGKSRIAIMASPMGMRAAKELSSIADMPCRKAPLGYSPQAAARFYGELAELCGKPRPANLAQWKAAAESALETAAVAAAEFEFAVDSSASLQSFMLAKTMLEHGFKVSCITTKGVTELEREAYDWIVENAPDVRIVRTHSYQALTKDGYGLNENLIAIGSDFARMIGAKRSVDLWHDEGVFAFQGIFKLCRMIEEAAR